MVESRFPFVRAARRCCVFLLPLFWLLASVVSAQNTGLKELPPEYQPNSDYESWFTDLEKSVDERWPDRVLERYAEELARKDYLGALRGLADEFRIAPWPTHGDLKARFQTRMDRVIDEFEKARAEAGVDGKLETREQRDALLAALNDRRVGTQSLLPEMARPAGGGAADLELVFFAGTLDDPDDPSEMIRTYQVDTSNDTFELLVPRDLMRDLRLRAEGVRAVLQHFVEPVQSAAFETIRLADAQWTNYLKNGYSQYPWEALINGKLWTFSEFDPPNQQLILLHPTIGFEASTGSLDHLVADEVINVELLGYVGYYGDEYEHFFGGSIAASLRNDVDPGIGFVLHWNKSFSAGVSWHDLDDDGDPFDDEPAVYMSFDLFRYVQTEGPAFKSKYDRVRALMPK
ncbi:MAG: hypothetical protein L6Q99_02905 [Planctomycetes bacterium]|nr:hypothetical protein [Planctomycetota bacterium]